MLKPKPQILYLDDDQYNLVAFKANFRDDYQVYVVSNYRDALEILKDHEITVVIADYRMPEMTGVKFFETIIPLYPETIRILLTGHADIQAVIDAINKGNIYRFINKPWDEKELRNTIQNACEIYQTRKQLKEKNQLLQKSYEDLDNFVYAVSHDLTAPLMSVLGLVKLAKSNPSNADIYLGMIEASAKKLKVFVNSIINFQINNSEAVSREPIDFKLLIEETIAELSLKDYPIDFALEIDQDAPFYGDEQRLKIIFNNIISNSVKFRKKNSDDQFIHVFVTVFEKLLTLSILDNGIGILDKHIDNVFDLFFRTSHEDAGSGIGLFIVKEVLKKLGGEIIVNSVFGNGTTFTLKIPEKI